jgi:hypothetical protein
MSLAKREGSRKGGRISKKRDNKEKGRLAKEMKIIKGGEN